MKLYTLSNGDRAPYPEKEMAVASRLRGYWSPDPCTLCGSHSKIVKGDYCLGCMNRACKALGNAALQGNFFSVFEEDETTGGLYIPSFKMGLPADISEIVRRRWNDYAADPNGFIRSGDVPKKGYFSLRRIVSPRQSAIAAGRSWYTPDDPCEHCKTWSLRHVVNGKCQHCEELAAASTVQVDQRRNNPTRQLIDSLPADYTIDRESAKAYGFTVFRTGKECRKGHDGWRWVSTGSCCDCTGTVTVR